MNKGTNDKKVPLMGIVITVIALTFIIMMGVLLAIVIAGSLPVH